MIPAFPASGVAHLTFSDGTFTGFACVGAAVILETAGQLTLKIGTRDMPHGPGAMLRRIFTNLWVQIAIISFLTEAVFWTWTLHLLPLAVAFPLGSICFATVALCSAWLLHERIYPTRWLGILLILCGVILIGSHARPV